MDAEVAAKVDRERLDHWPSAKDDNKCTSQSKFPTFSCSRSRIIEIPHTRRLLADTIRHEPGADLGRIPAATLQICYQWDMLRIVNFYSSEIILLQSRAKDTGGTTLRAESE